MIIEKSRVPALDACRHLLATGVTGKLVVSIERGAQLTISDGASSGLALAPRRTFGEGDEDDDVGSIG